VQLSVLETGDTGGERRLSGGALRQARRYDTTPCLEPMIDETP